MAGRDRARSVARAGPVVSRARPVDVDPWQVLRAFAGERVAWSPPSGATVVGTGAAAILSADGSDRFDAIRRGGTALFDEVEFTPASGVERTVPPAARPRLFGGFAFHADRAPAGPWVGFPPARFVLPRIQLATSDAGAWLTATTAGPDADGESAEAALDSAVDRIAATPTTRSPPPGIANVRRTPGRAVWRRQVRRVLDRIEAGELEKVVLAGTLIAQLRGPFRLADTMARFAEAAADCYGFAVDPGLGAAFFGATPEQLLTRRGRQVETEALAGSIGRGGTEAEDDRLTRQLTDSPRIGHEHDLVTDTIREQLSTLADRVTVGERGVRKLGSVQHLETPISATLGDDAHVLELVEALHPTPAVGGLPPVAAQRTIRATETFDRGWYAGPIGWFDAQGDGAFAVAIRSAVTGSGTATLFAGNGLVQDSRPDAEWDELQLKYRPVLDQLRS